MREPIGDLDITLLPDGLRVPVKVAPRASRAKVLGLHGSALKVALTAPPVDGAANAALVQLLSKLLGIPKGAVSIVRGDRSRDKLVELRGVTLEMLRTHVLPPQDEGR